MVKIKTIQTVDYFELQKTVEAILSEKECRKVNIRDYTDKYTPAGFKEQLEAELDYLESLGYNRDEVERARNRKNSKEDWPALSPEMRLRIEVNTKINNVRYGPKSSDLLGERPFQDFWNWWLEHVDSEISNGSISYNVDLKEILNLLKEDPDPNNEWIKTILSVFVEVTKDLKTLNIQYSW